MSTTPQAPTLHFFRATPRDVAGNPPLASSLQSLETCFFLIAFERYPHALLSCASAIESAIRAYLKRPVEDETPLTALLEEIRRRSNNLRLFDGRKLADFRRARNRIVHYGFSPEDDDMSVRLLLQTGLPFLKKCYQELFSFYLDWLDVRPGVQKFGDLSHVEMEKVSLVPYHADQLRVASEVFAKAKDLQISMTYCFTSFAHHVRVMFKGMVVGDAEQSVLNDGDATWEAEQKHKREWRKVFHKMRHDPCFDLLCPICGGCDTLVAQLDEDRLDDPVVSFRMGACVKCGLIIPNAPYLADILLRHQIQEKTEEIFKDAGIEERPKT